MIWRAAICLVMCVACEKHSSEATSASASASAAPAHVAHVTLDDKDVPAPHAMIRKTPTGLQIFVGSGGTCEELAQHMFNGKNKFILADLDAPANGVARVTRVWTGPPFDADPGGTVTVHGDPTPASKVDIDFAFTSKEAKLDARGTLSAEVCK